jgi:predicted lipid-binding transport protein (Tim44 family)
VTDVKLLQGDLAEAWREGHNDYATVAMRFALRDSLVERASGRIVEGGDRSDVAELWSFVRARGGNWLLSAIQQTSARHKLLASSDVLAREGGARSRFSV